MKEAAPARRYVQRRRAEAAAANAARIVDAATEIFFASGDAPTLDAVAARAGVTVQTVLRRYGSKDGLFAACVDAGLRAVGRERGAVVPGDVDGALDNLMAHYDAWADRSLRMLQLEGTSPAATTAVTAARSLHHAWVATAFAPQLGRFAAPLRRRRLAQLVAVTDVHVWKLLHRDQRLSRADTRRALRELVEPLLAPTSATPKSPANKRTQP